jgi:adenylosuccinate lyase
MILNSLTAISPVDGRYRDKVESLGAYFSEYALIRYRVLIEIEYFIALCDIPLPGLTGFSKSNYGKLREIYLMFSLEDAMRVKEIEAVTNHDVKAVEYFLKEKFDQLFLQDFKEFIHFGLTSQDINNTALPLSIAEALGQGISSGYGFPFGEAQCAGW